MDMLAEEGIDAYVADGLFRKRDPRFDNSGRYKEEHKKRPGYSQNKIFTLILSLNFADALPGNAFIGVGTVEPVFGNIRHTLRLDRFSLRGKLKVNSQWLLFCTLHNLRMIHRYGSVAVT